jgi:hypothetical protein
VKTHTIWVLSLVFAMTSANGAQGIKEASDAVKKVVNFPDVCRTPAPGDPIPIPYPNAVEKSKIDFNVGTKNIKRGGKIKISKGEVPKHSGAGTLKGLPGVSDNHVEFLVMNDSGREVEFEDSVLIELEDGSYCAICVEKNRVTTVLRLSVR